MRALSAASRHAGASRCDGHPDGARGRVPRRRGARYSPARVSTLLLIRHGQASFGADDYDVLSPRGIEQARALGRYLGGRARPLDALYAGPRRRQIDTAHHARAAAAEAGLELPAITEIPELDEYPAFELLRYHIESGAVPPDATTAAADGSLDRVFEAMTRQWVRGELDTGALETFAAFGARVERGLRAVMDAEGRGRQVAVVTSGGPISIAMRKSLSLPDEMVMRIAAVIGNASVTEMRWRGSELSLFGFNHLHHVGADLVTYR